MLVTRRSIGVLAKRQKQRSMTAVNCFQVISCFTEIDKPPGCECQAGCSGAANNITAVCRQAIIDTYCENAVWIEADVGVNLRSIFLHLLNDCYQGTPVDCPPNVRPPRLRSASARSQFRPRQNTIILNFPLFQHLKTIPSVTGSLAHVTMCSGHSM